MKIPRPKIWNFFVVFVLRGKNAYIKRKKTIYNCVHVNEILRILFSSVILTDLITKSWVLGQLKNWIFYTQRWLATLKCLNPRTRSDAMFPISAWWCWKLIPQEYQREGYCSFSTSIVFFLDSCCIRAENVLKNHEIRYFRFR